MNLRKLSSGDLVAPRRGQPPAVPDGYFRDKGDSFVFHPILPECSCRTYIKPKCCGNSLRMFCTKRDSIITQQDCLTENEQFFIEKEVWLAGKGPSLDTYSWSMAGKCRIGINEAAFLIPDCYAAIAIDYPILEKFKTLPEKVYTLRKKTHVRWERKNEFIWTPSMCPFMGATAPIAIQILYSLGARTFHFVGFDSWTGTLGYSTQIQKINGAGRNRDGFKRINTEIKKILDQKKELIPIWEHLS